MAKIKLPSFDGGTLLQRTLLYLVTFVLGSAGFLAIASFMVVWAAKSIIPARGTESAASATEKVAELNSGQPSGKVSRPKKGRTITPADDAPAVEEHR